LYFPLVNLWDKRSLIFHFAILNIKLRFKSTYLGFLWSAIEPLLYFSVLYIVFTSIRVGADDTFPIYLITGVLMFHIFIRGTSGGIISLTGNIGILNSLKIKKELFPVVSTLAISILAVVDVGVFFLLMLIFDFTPTLTIILIPIPIILLLFLIQGLSYLLSIGNVFARDIQYIWIIFTHAMFFITPIFWFLTDVDGILLEIQKINPLGQIIEITHQLVVFNQIPPLSEWLYTSAFVFAILGFGYIIFRKYENKIVEEL